MTALILSLACCFQLAPPNATDARDEERTKILQELKNRLKTVQGEIDQLRQQVERAAGAPEETALRLALAGKLREQAHLIYSLEGEDPRFPTRNPPEADRAQQAALVLLKVVAKSPVTAYRAKALLETIEVLRELNQYDEVIKTIGDLVDKLPETAEAGRALALLGDYYFDNDQMPSARDTYRKVLKGPYTADVQDLARYKLGWVLINQVRQGADRTAWEEPLVLFEQIIRSRPAGPPPPPGKPGSNLRWEVLAAMVFCYTEARPDNKLLSFLESLALSPDEARMVLQKFANRYFIRERFATARILYRKLLTMVSDPEDAADFRQRLEDIEDMIRHKK